MSKSESDENSSGDEDFEAHSHLFRSSLDVGSHFIDIVPENELTFYNNQGTMLTQMTIKNVTNKAHVAFFVFTSAPYPIKILPKNGFIPPMYQQVIKIGWEAQDRPDPEKLSHAMFFIKALPLSHEMNVDEMNGNLGEVFNTYNVNILFTVAALPAKVALGGGPPGMVPMIQPPPNTNAALIQPGQTPPPRGGSGGGGVPQNEAKANFIPQTTQKVGATGMAPQVGKKFGEDDLEGGSGYVSAAVPDEEDGEAQILIHSLEKKRQSQREALQNISSGKPSNRVQPQ